MRLDLTGVRAHYGDHLVLDGVDLALTPGQRVVILGSNGSGKTTLLKLLSGALAPTAGAVSADGVPLRHDRKGLASHRRRVQLVLQDPDDQLFSADVVRDVSFGPMNLDLPTEQVIERVDEALAMLAIEHLRERPVHQLSYGERKRVTLAGAAAMRPEVLLLDEPSAGLDPHGVSELVAALERLEARGTSLVMSTHEVDLALGWADAAVVVADHRITVGPVQTLLADADLLARARLHRPWVLELAGRLGWSLTDSRLRTLDDVQARLVGSVQG